MPAQGAPAAPRRLHLSVWRIVTWVLLLLAIFGIFQYCQHAWRVASGLGAAGGADAHAALVRMVAWDAAYLAGACITVATAAGTLLWRGWARPALRVVVVLLALWLLITAIMLGAHWMDFNHRSRMLMAQPGLGDAARAMLAHVRRSYLVAIVLKAVAVPILVWLAWRLGAPAVRAQFQRSPARKTR